MKKKELCLDSTWKQILLEQDYEAWIQLRWDQFR